MLDIGVYTYLKIRKITHPSVLQNLYKISFYSVMMRLFVKLEVRFRRLQIFLTLQMKTRCSRFRNIA